MSADDKSVNAPGPRVQPQYILAPYMPSPHDVVERMLSLAEVNSGDVVYDLGCGDGRIVVAAAEKYGARGVGVDIEPYWVGKCNALAKERGVEHLTTFRAQDALTVDVTDATVIMLYLVHWSVPKLQPTIRRQVNPGTRIVSQSFHMKDWLPNKTEKFTDSEGTARTIHLWVR